ncbi:Ppx/GppA phosphatase family protein [Cutibacterium sp. V947]|uniref:Ppx/GppA phosphatase family protein n=1 Tax=unclassified Cutibacterium TaxID=2649671 RepID=UPI003EE2FF68
MTDNRTVAAIDCGTNSIRLLISSAGPEGHLVEQARDLELVRLGQGVDATGAFHPDALERTFTACRTFARIIAEHHCDEVRFVATSAARDVSNRDEFFAGVREALGVDAEVIAGTEEASLSFVGAMSGIEVSEEPVLLIDCGGGSTELVLGHGRQIESRTSLNIGSVRLRERFLRGDPPTAEQIDEARTYVREMVAECPVDVASAHTVVGVAGTITSLSAINQGLTQYDRSKVHRSVLTADQVADLADTLLASTVDEVEQMGPLKRRRAEVLCGGALIIDEVCHRATAGELVVSEKDILDGMALAMLAQGEPTSSPAPVAQRQRQTA